MTVTTHIAEILRQGIWASLTGGWYYEPAHSIFCNTVHLYLWLVLLIVPLVVGFVTSGALSSSLLIGYTCFIGVLFSILKTIVARLHVVFDTTEPVITTKVLPESETRNRTNDDIGGDGADIKLEITKFLEELIEKHPETLDVIENVRQSRLGRNSANRVPHMLRMHGVRSRRRSSSSSVSALSDMALRDGTHVASGHEDTSQGAVHSFQDADGMWWTYAFDEHGVGTAQPLGSGRALMELLQSAQDPPALPESAYVSSEDEAEPCSSRTAANLPALNVGNTRRERALSSSSNESYTYIPQLPTTVFHAPTGTGAIRASTRREMVSFANVASRLRAAVRNSESITLILSGECPAPATRRTSTVKKSYYYKMKMFPKTNKSFKLKLDRLSVSALFDRNRSVLSCIFDVFLACLISFLAGLVLATGIYFDLWLFMFAFTVAGAHFSLLKSVQPDASSPIHGFNWLVAYSRPVYFCIGAVIVLMLHHFSDDPRYDKIPWNWNPYRLYETSGEMILLAFRDLFATFLVTLPFAFTMGWLPQVNTLIHHVLEQLEMHIFGGTASLGVFSAVLQIIKSLMCWALCNLAFSVDSKTTQTPAFSAFLSVAVATSYLLSRNEYGSDGLDVSDPLPGRLRSALVLRARHDVLFSTFLSLMVFALHSTSLFTATQPYFTMIVVPICVVFGIMNHYIYQQLRTHTPWKLIAKPVLHSKEYTQYESTDEAKLMTFEIIHVWMLAIEKNFLYPLVAVAMLTECGWLLPVARVLGPLIILRFLRGGFSHPQLIYMPLALAFTISHFDWNTGPPFGLSKVLLYPKWLELYLKMSFVMAYVAPWQISWGSAFHAFAQPFSIPHSALIWTQTVLSSLLSAPLNPFLGSSFFITSYVRPVKFWERDYNTKRSDASNTTLASQIDRGPMLDDSNLNAVFYEHLTRSLQKSLAGDLQMGRWSTGVQPGDCFILASFYLNCLVHIIEVGNGFVTFQLRGLEFRGTYCHQREVEAISDDQSQGTGCCCCAPGSLPGLLSLNTAWSLRWLAWEVVTGKYIIDGYSITDNSAVNLLQVHELRRLLVTLYVKCIVYYTFASSKLQHWLRNTLEPIVANPRYADVDHLFCSTNDEDFDMNEMGISRSSFTEWYSSWVSHCINKRVERNSEEYVTCLCYVLSLLGRRALGAASYNRHSNAAESFLCGLHALFKGDFRITCQRDEWVFADMDLLRCVIAPAVKMALKLHQDHFAAPDDFDDSESLFNLIADYQTKLFISHEHDPAWRRAIIANTPSLLALRHMYDEGQDDYKIIMLNRMHLNMRVIKLNRECVRAFWAGQQQELIFLRNRNPERGSIQNARQVLRNMINSSADQPVGYPIYVSPLTTSFVETHSQMAFVDTFTFFYKISKTKRTWLALRAHFGPSGSSSFGLHGGCGPVVPTIALQQYFLQENSIVHMTPDGGARVALARRIPGSSDTSPGANKFSSTDPALQVVRKEKTRKKTRKNWRSSVIPVCGCASMIWNRYKHLEFFNFLSPYLILWFFSVFRCLNEPLKSTGEPLVLWPSEEIRQISGRNSWCCQPTEGLMGRVMFSWHPNHPNRKFRSHIGDAIYLVASPEMSRTLVPVSEKGCTVLTPEQVLELQSGENRKVLICILFVVMNRTTLVFQRVSQSYKRTLPDCCLNKNTNIPLFHGLLTIPVEKVVRQCDTKSLNLFNATLQWMVNSLN
uniref:Pecanex-like protein n=1 Tax=Angiostrongylus cantonensis TaxID=6313 RepID=A0A158P6Q6_ANGCA